MRGPYLVDGLAVQADDMFMLYVATHRGVHRAGQVAVTGGAQLPLIGLHVESNLPLLVIPCGLASDDGAARFLAFGVVVGVDFFGHPTIELAQGCAPRAGGLYPAALPFRIDKA